MATLSDIAAVLGLNKTTVSKALNNSSDISRETRERVLQEADRMGYNKHKLKRAARNESTLVGVICPEVGSYYYSQIVSFLNSHLQEKGFGMIMTISGFSAEAEQQQLARLVEMDVAGIIIITEETNLSPVIHATPGASRIPIVIIGLNYESRDHDVVSIDEQYGIRALVEHLVERGHQKIAFVGDHLVSKRLDYLKMYLHQKSLDIAPEHIVLSKQRNEECGYSGMQRLLKLENRPSAVVAGYDSIALGAYRAIMEAGLRVPEDVALAGFDDSDFCRYLPDSLTSINSDVEAECRVATAILFSRMRETRSLSTQAAAIVPRLITRESTRTKLNK